MDSEQIAGCSVPLIDLTNDVASNGNHTVPYIDLTVYDDKGTNHSPEIIDLTDDDKEHFSSNMHVTDLTDDNDQFLNFRIPVIDLINDEQDITLPTNRITNVVDLTADDIQDKTLNTPINDLTSDNKQFLNCGKHDIEITSDDVHDITHRFQSFDLTDVKKQNKNDPMPLIDLTNDSYQSINPIIPGIDLNSDKNCINDKSDIDLIQNNDRAIIKLVEDVEMEDLSCNNLPTSFKQDEIENGLRIPTGNINYEATESEFLKCNEYSTMNLPHRGNFSGMKKFQHRKEILENHPLTYRLEGRKETILTNPSTKKSFEGIQETILKNYSLRNNFENRKETILTNHSLINKPEERNLNRRKSQLISQKNPSDIFKSALHPIPLRHSLGRSTVNTSQNIPIECTDVSESQSRTFTVSSIIRRKESKSIAVISNHNSPKSKDLLTSRQSIFPFQTFKGFFLKFWIFLLLIFIILLVSLLNFKIDMTNS